MKRSTTQVVGDRYIVEEGNRDIDDIKKMIDTDIERAVCMLEEIDVSHYPKKQIADVYWLLSECYSTKKKYIRSHIMKQKACSIDDSILSILSTHSQFDHIDSSIQYNI